MVVSDPPIELADGESYSRYCGKEACHIIIRDGVELYKRKRYRNKGDEHWWEYQVVGKPLLGQGVGLMLADNEREALSRARSNDALQRKADRRSAYEDRVYEALDAVAELQTSIVSIANDPDAGLSSEQASKLRLGLQAADSILNRALGKPVTKIDAEITQTVADEMMSIAEGWIVEECDE